MPNIPVQVLLFMALAYTSYHYAGRPVAHGVKVAAHKTCHVLTVGKKCK